MNEEKRHLVLRPLTGITRKKRYYLDGNGIYDEPMDGVYFYASEEGDFNDDMIPIEDAFMSFINIAEYMNPLIFCARRDEERNAVKWSQLGYGYDVIDSRIDSLYDLLSVSIETLKNKSVKDELVAEVSKFIKKYGFIHMEERASVLEPHEKVVKHHVHFYEHEDQIQPMDMLGNLYYAQKETAKTHLFFQQLGIPAPRYFKKRVNTLKHTDESQHFLDSKLASCIKCYERFSKFESEQVLEKERYSEIRMRIEDLIKKESDSIGDEFAEYYDEYDEFQRQITLIHPSKEVVEGAAQLAFKNLEECRDNLKEFGLIEVESPFYYYRLSALLREGFLLYLASMGDLDAFNKIKGLFHVRTFWTRSKENFRKCKVVWFESSCHDTYNPGSCLEPYELHEYGDTYLPEDYNLRFLITGGEKVFEKCVPEEIGYSMDSIIRNHLASIAEKFIDLQASKNYKFKFKPARNVCSKKDKYLINDEEHDLMSTFWGYLSYLNKSHYVPDLTYCSVCGKLVVKKRADSEGRKTEFCPDGCRMFHHRHPSIKKHEKERGRYYDFMTRTLMDDWEKREEFDLVARYETDDGEIEELPLKIGPSTKCAMYLLN